MTWILLKRPAEKRVREGRKAEEGSLRKSLGWRWQQSWGGNRHIMSTSVLQSRGESMSTIKANTQCLQKWSVVQCSVLRKAV